MEINVQLHNEFNVKQEYIDNIINFLDSGCTVPLSHDTERNITALSMTRLSGLFPSALHI